MPRNYRRKMYRRKRKIGRKSRPTVNVNRSLQPFSQRYITKMKYAEQITQIGPGLGGLTQFQMNLNSIFDPNRTGTGHQPYGHDTLATIYNRYRVISCSYVISALGTGGTNGDAYSIIGALPANESIAVTGGLSEVQENPRCSFITQAPNAPLKVLKGKVDIASLVGRSKSQYMSDDRYQATYGSSPNELAILNIFVGLLNGDAQTITTKLNVVMEFTVESFDVKQLFQS